MKYPFRDRAALVALPALIENYPDADGGELAERAFDIADFMEIERARRADRVLLGALDDHTSFAAGDSDIDLGEDDDDPADASLGPIVEIETDVLTRNEHRPEPVKEPGWREFHDSLEDRKAGDTSPVVKGRKP